MPKSNEVKRAGRSKVSIPSSFSPLESSPKVVPKRTNGAAKRQPSMSGMNGDPQTGASGYFMGICVIIGLSLAVLVVLTLSMPHFYGRLILAISVPIYDGNGWLCRWETGSQVIAA